MVPLKYARAWLLLAPALVCWQALCSVFVSRGPLLTALGDTTQCVLLIGCVFLMFSNAACLSGRPKLFWALIGSGFVVWFSAQLLWTYFEVIAHREVPNPFVGDVILFLHLVPMMAALAVQPHRRQNDESPGYGSLDFFMLLMWWLYLYLFIVIPWQYVYPDEAVYGRSFDAAFLAEHIVFILGLVLVRNSSSGAWRRVYGLFLATAVLYAISSAMAGVAIDLHVYYTGSFYDVPLVAAIAAFCLVAASARTKLPDAAASTPGSVGEYRIWAARLAMVPVLSTPLMIAWAAFASVPPQVRTYRLILTTATMLAMSFLVLRKEHLLDRQLIRLLRESREHLHEMRLLKDNLLKKEELLRWQTKELQNKNLELQEVSFTDSLTGLWNRRYLEETLAADAAMAVRNHWQARTGHNDLVFIMVDVDFFKQVNDHYGHAAGDDLLRQIAGRLSKIMRKSDVLVRWGGEEFLIVTRSADVSGTPIFCNRILDVIASEAFDLGGGMRLRKTCSAGWAPYPWCASAFDAICAEEVIELADRALYLAKSCGRNQVIGFLPSPLAESSPKGIHMEKLREEHTELIKIVRTLGAEKSERRSPNGESAKDQGPFVSCPVPFPQRD